MINAQTSPVHLFRSKLEPPDLFHQKLMREGETVLQQADAATRAVAHGCDAIVMGTRGMGAVAGLLLGSVAAKAVPLAPVSITLVK